MAMNVGSGGGENEVMLDINTTPLIDVMLVLLVMLIITIPIQTHAVKLDMPKPNQKPPLIQPQIVTIDVDFDGSILWNGQLVTRQKLDDYLYLASQQDPQPEIHLQPNRLAKYDAVAKVLSDAQRIGVIHIGFVGNEQYMQ